MDVVSIRNFGNSCSNRSNGLGDHALSRIRLFGPGCLRPIKWIFLLLTHLESLSVVVVGVAERYFDRTRYHPIRNGFAIPVRDIEMVQHSGQIHASQDYGRHHISPVETIR